MSGVRWVVYRMSSVGRDVWWVMKSCVYEMMFAMSMISVVVRRGGRRNPAGCNRENKNPTVMWGKAHKAIEFSLEFSLWFFKPGICVAVSSEATSICLFVFCWSSQDAVDTAIRVLMKAGAYNPELRRAYEEGEDITASGTRAARGDQRNGRFLWHKKRWKKRWGAGIFVGSKLGLSQNKNWVYVIVFCLNEIVFLFVSWCFLKQYLMRKWFLDCFWLKLLKLRIFASRLCWWQSSGYTAKLSQLSWSSMLTFFVQDQFL